MRDFFPVFEDSIVGDDDKHDTPPLSIYLLLFTFFDNTIRSSWPRIDGNKRTLPVEPVSLLTSQTTFLLLSVILAMLGGGQMGYEKDTIRLSIGMTLDG